MLLELHILQNFAPSCLNRDDTNSPKDCEFGGFRRARVSSQCIKRAMRRHFRAEDRLGNSKLLDDSELAYRTRRLVEKKLVPRLITKEGRTREQAIQAATAALDSVKNKPKDKDKDNNKDKNLTQYLLFIAHNEVEELTRLIDHHWDTLLASAPSNDQEDEGKNTPRRKNQKKAAKAAVPKEIAEQVVSLFQRAKAADLALFGRMLADAPGTNIDAASQVAHAISTNAVSSMELDYFTAVDDLQQRGDEAGTGAAMIGTVEFNSACFYRYANIHLPQLRTNLQDDEALARRTLEAFIRASIEAIPTGKQNSMAAQNPPDFVLAVVRNSGLWSLANAFLKPLRPDDEHDLMQQSVAALDAYWGRLKNMYGTSGLVVTPYSWTEGRDLPQLNGNRVPNIDGLIQSVLSHANFDSPRARS